VIALQMQMYMGAIQPIETMGHGGLDGVDENIYRSRMIVKKKDDREAAPPNSPGRIASSALLGPRRELVIVHNGREYRLRVTQNGKLLLTA
jgi:hemin uptake protein HemP